VGGSCLRAGDGVVESASLTNRYVVTWVAEEHWAEGSPKRPRRASLTTGHGFDHKLKLLQALQRQFCLPEAGNTQGLKHQRTLAGPSS